MLHNQDSKFICPHCGRSSSVLEELEAVPDKRLTEFVSRLSKSRANSGSYEYDLGWENACEQWSNELHALIGRYREPK